jgi:hypothetical protein
MKKEDIKEPGYYWVRTHKKRKGYNAIIRIMGEAPFFTSGICSDNFIDNDSVRGHSIGVVYDIGPKVQIPELELDGL